ncbi:MAG: AraC family transcriptional regulator [Clostridiales bacterium]|nr:AraC family transcriptional regulator [Clostridiales bacterium]
MKSIKIIHNFHFQSLFFKTAFILILSVTLITGSFFVILQNIITKNSIETECSNMHSLLSQASSILEDKLEHCHAQSMDVLSNPSTASLMATPDRNDFSRVLEASTLLNNYVQKNEFVVEAWIYLKSSQQVLTSNQELKNYADCEHFPAACLDQLKDSDSFLLFTDENKYYLATTYPSWNSLGVLISRISPLYLYRQISDDINLASNHQLYLYDDVNNPLFPALLHYPSEEDLQVDELYYQQDNLQIYRAANSRNLICYYQIPGTEWKWIQILSDSILFPSLSNIFKGILPFISIVLIVIIALAFYLMFTIYRPLARLLQKLITPSNHKQVTSARNEWELIGNSLEFSHTQNSNMSTILNEVAPAIQTKLFQALLSADTLTEEEISERLASIKSPFTTNGHYLVLAIQATGINNDLKELEQSIFTLGLKNTAEDYWASRCLCMQFQEYSPGLLMGVIGFETDTSKSKITLAISDFRQQILSYAKDYAFQPQIGESSVVDTLCLLHAAAMEAQKTLHYRRYFKDNPAAADKKTISSPSVMETFFRSRTEQYLHQAESGTTTDPAVLRELVHAASIENNSKELYQQIHQTILSILLPTVGSLEKLPFSVNEYLENPRSFSNTKETEKYLLDCLTASIDFLYQKAQTDRNSYVEQAKKYIAEHYADSNLSQETVCSHIGISAPYFSSLFSEQEHQNFLDYVHQYRIEQARQLLFATNYTVAEIGFRTGFNSANSFIRVFKKLMGETPGKYRERVKKA